MALESATYISQLVPANPPASDPIAQAANHLNLIKSVLQTTFPHATTPLSATMENLNNGTPVGLIAMWSGGSLPAGWTLCNGVAVGRSDGTGSITPPDLRDRFVVGSGLSYGTTATGGVAVYQLAVSQLPAHSHGVIDGGHAHGVNDGGHAHGVNDPGHVHGVPPGGNTGNPAPGFNVAQWNGNEVSTTRVGTGISIAASGAGISIAAAGAGISIGATGSNVPIENRPPFYALAFIMKV